MDVFCSRIKEGDVVIDVGAYIGIFSLLASERVGSTGCVYAFEPIPSNYERLIRNIKANEAENIKAYNFGLSDKAETLRLSIPIDIPAEASLANSCTTELNTNTTLKKDAVKSRLIPFDQFYEDENLGRVNIIKIDIEGAELKVIKGMQNTLRKFNDIDLFLEVTPPLIKLLDGSVVELVELLADCGFETVYQIESDSKINISNVGRVSVETYFGNLGRNYVVRKKGLK